jgi:hypothetical protein
MDEFVAQNSRVRLALFLLGAIVLVWGGLLLIGAFGPLRISNRHSPEVMAAFGWFGIAFFGACAILIAKRLFEGGEALRIDRTGISFAAWSDQTIPWSEITDITEWSFRGQRSIILHLRDPARFPGKGVLGFAAKANRALTGGDVPISLTGTNRSFDEAVAAITRFRPAMTVR